MKTCWNAAAGLTLLLCLSSPSFADNVVWDLDNVVSISLANHPLVSQAAAEIQAASARKGQARSAYFPTIGLSAGYSRSRSFSGPSRLSATTSSEFVQGNLSQNIFDFGRTRAAVGRADAFLSSARESGEAVRDNVVFSAKVAYFDVLRSRRIVAVAGETLKQRESLLNQAQAYYQAGIRARIDVARAEANLFQARAELTSAENDLRIARITLLNRMGIDGPRDFEIIDTLAAESLSGTLEEWIREAEKNRPDLRALRERERAAEMSLRAAGAEYNPRLTGEAGYGYEAEDPPLDQNYNLSVVLSVPLFSGFLTRHEVAEARAQLSSIRFAVTDFRRQVSLQVEEAALSVRAASELSDARAKEREASAENLRLATARYEVGAGSIIEMIDAQVQMTRSDTDMIDALYDYSVSVAILHRALGR